MYLVYFFAFCLVVSKIIQLFGHLVMGFLLLKLEIFYFFLRIFYLKVVFIFSFFFITNLSMNIFGAYLFFVNFFFLISYFFFNSIFDFIYLIKSKNIFRMKRELLILNKKIFFSEYLFTFLFFNIFNIFNIFLLDLILFFDFFINFYVPSYKVFSSLLLKNRLRLDFIYFIIGYESTAFAKIMNYIRGLP